MSTATINPDVSGIADAASRVTVDGSPLEVAPTARGGVRAESIYGQVLIVEPLDGLRPLWRVWDTASGRIRNTIGAGEPVADAPFFGMVSTDARYEFALVAQFAKWCEQSDPQRFIFVPNA